MDAHKSVFRHIVFIVPKDGALCDEIIRRMKALGQGVAGLRTWVIVESKDTRKGRFVIEDSTFESEGAFLGFRLSQPHREFTNFLKDVADWRVGDYDYSET